MIAYGADTDVTSSPDSSPPLKMFNTWIMLVKVSVTFKVIWSNPTRTWKSCGG